MDAQRMLAASDLFTLARVVIFTSAVLRRS